MLVGDGMDVKVRALTFSGYNTPRFLRVMNFSLVFLPENRVLGQLRRNVFLSFKKGAALCLGCATSSFTCEVPRQPDEKPIFRDNNRTVVLMVSRGK